ncbi:MAG: porin, partial [Alphaproteobacteria bacterium]|nr:porin [Alphaproteobacteria bacterium]
MKKLLLGTTALVGASVVAGSALAVPLQSQDEDGTQVLTAGMVSQWEVGTASNDNYTGSANTSDHGMLNGRFAEIWMNGELTADNGLVYGATIHMGTGAVVTTGWPGREYIFMNGGWGSLEFGNNFQADSGMALCPTCRTYAGANGGIDAGLRYIAMPAGAADGGGAAASGIRARAGAPYRQWFSKGIGVTYYTPIVSGFQAGITYAPNTAANAANAVDNTGGVYKDKIGFGGQWKGDFGDVNVGLSAVGAVSDGYLTAAQGTTGTNNIRDVNGLGMYMLSAQIGWGSFQVGGQY